jgi:SPX domain protein involved in polyphosphate accumulation
LVLCAQGKLGYFSGGVSLMKFGKNLIRIVDLSDPEWGPYWINYAFMKKKINEIIINQVCKQMSDEGKASNALEISKSAIEVEFFKLLKSELKKASTFFSSAEEIFRLRHSRVNDGFVMLQDKIIEHDKNTWSRLLMACVKFYKDVLLLENFAIMNYCGFSKILKKHDKLTGFSTRESFMRNVMNKQNFTHYPFVLTLLKQSEKLYNDIQQMDR